MPAKSSPEQLSEDASHADILAAVQKCIAAVDLQQLTLQRVEIKVDEVRKCLGDEGEDDRGQKVGTGVRGRLMRLEGRVDKRFRTYDDWRNYAMGAVATAVLLLTALWWLVQDKVGHVLR